MNAFGRYLGRCGIEFDTSVNVLFGGQLGQTVSYRVAVAARDGKRWGCIFCWFLSWAVQKNHCALQFEKGPSPVSTYIRAGIAFATAFLALAGLVRIGVTFARHLL
jgi:hypothetical protein